MTRNSHMAEVYEFILLIKNTQKISKSKRLLSNEKKDLEQFELLPKNSKVNSQNTKKFLLQLKDQKKSCGVWLPRQLQY